MIKEILSYRTDDGRIFTKKDSAIAYENILKDKKKLAETSEKVRQLFKEELTMYANSTNEYSGINLDNADLECDFWDDVSGALADDSNVDVTLVNFTEYVSLIKTLLKDFHLEEVIKIIKKITPNSIKETL